MGNYYYLLWSVLNQYEHAYTTLTWHKSCLSLTSVSQSILSHCDLSTNHCQGRCFYLHKSCVSGNPLIVNHTVTCPNSLCSSLAEASVCCTFFDSIQILSYIRLLIRDIDAPLPISTLYFCLLCLITHEHSDRTFHLALPVPFRYTVTHFFLSFLFFCSHSLHLVFLVHPHLSDKC